MKKDFIPLHALVTQELYKAVEEFAVKANVPKAYVVRAALVQYLKKNPQLDLDDLVFDE